MKKEEQHIDKLFQGLKTDSFVAPQSFMDDLKLRMDAKAKLAARRKLTFWFVLTCIVLIGIASIIMFTPPKNSVNEAQKQVSSAEFTNTAKGEANSIKTQNKKTVPLIDDATSKTTEIENRFDTTNLNEHSSKIASQKDDKVDLKNSRQLTKNDSNSKFNKNTIFSNFENGNAKDGVNRKSKLNEDLAKKDNFQKANFAQSNSSNPSERHAELTGKNNENLKNNISTSASSRTNGFGEVKSGEPVAHEDRESKFATQKSTSEASDLNEKELLLTMKTQNVIDNPFDLSLEEQENISTVSNLDALKTNKKLEFNVEAYGGILSTNSKYNPLPQADDFASSSLISPSFGLKTNILYQNMYGSAGVEYFKTGNKQTFSTKTFSQVGIDSVLTVTYFDTVWIDSVTFVYDSLVDYQITPILDSVTERNMLTNQYTWISIPLSFGYRFQFNSWDVIPNVGVNLNFGIGKNSGEYPNESNQLVKYDALKFNMDIRIQTEVRRNFGKYYVFASPYFRKNLKPIISYPSMRLTQNNWGLNAGFGVKF